MTKPSLLKPSLVDLIDKRKLLFVCRRLPINYGQSHPTLILKAFYVFVHVALQFEWLNIAGGGGGTEKVIQSATTIESPIK